MFEEKPLADGANDIKFGADAANPFIDGAEYTINIHTVLNNGNKFDSAPITDTITGYQLRTQDDVDAIYLKPDGTSILTYTLGDFSKDITIAGTLSLPA